MVIRADRIPSLPPFLCGLGVEIELVLTDYLPVLRGMTVARCDVEGEVVRKLYRSSSCGELEKAERALAGALVCFGTGARQSMFSAPCQAEGVVLIGVLIWGWGLSLLAMWRA